MKKTIVLLLLLLGLYDVSAQQVTVENLSDFTTIKVFDRLLVELIPSSDPKVEIFGEKSNEVQVISKGGELKVRMPTFKLLGGDEIRVKIYYTDLISIQASEGAEVTSKNSIESPSMYLNAKEGAKIKVEINAPRINARINSGGEISVSGKVTEQDILITSGGQYNAKKLDTQKTVAVVNAGGNAAVIASDLVDAKIRAGGTINIYGNPDKVNQKILAGGNIIIHK